MAERPLSVLRSYDKADRLLTLVDSASGPISYTYDGLDRMTQETTPLGSVQYSYDNAGRRTQMLPTQQQSVDYVYDADGRLLELHNAGDVVRIVYDNADRYASVQLRNGVTQAYAYDAAGQLTSITYSTATTTLGNLTYDYDALGRVIRQGGTLAKVDLPAAMSGNTYNANNQLAMSGYSYDANGRMTSNGASTFTWDARGQLAQISGPIVAQFSYDPLGRRARKSINSVPTQFLYDGPNIIQELADGASPGVNATYLTGFGIDETLGRTIGATKTDYLSDRLGSALALTDASANMSANYSYEPYGKSTKFGGSDQTALTFTGREDDATGLAYLRARYYAPSNGRFLSEDPIGLAGRDFNLYRYAASDPLNHIDPNGLSTVSIDCGLHGFLIRTCGVGDDHCICRKISTEVINECFASSSWQCVCREEFLKSECSTPPPPLGPPPTLPPPHRPPFYYPPPSSLPERLACPSP